MKLLLSLFLINLSFGNNVAWVFNGQDVQFEDIDYIVYSKNKASYQDKIRVFYTMNIQIGEKYCSKRKIVSKKVSSAACLVHTESDGSLKFPFYRDRFGKCKKKEYHCLNEKIAIERTPLEVAKVFRMRFSPSHKKNFKGSEKYKIMLDPKTGCFSMKPFSANTKSHVISDSCFKSYIK